VVPVAKPKFNTVLPALSAAHAGAKHVPVLRVSFSRTGYHRSLSSAAPNDTIPARRRSLFREVFGEIARLVTGKRHLRAADQKLGN